ncbi:MAG: hypothetical protein NTY43_03045 [Bacteroidetes bacterium]|jgi:hypothetical protein|nr:hypothetical protein [Bacteroidota bacterium]
MKKIYQQILDFPQMVNQKVLNAQLNSAVDNFDSQNGVRSYTKSIYQILSIVVLISMEVAIIHGAMGYFADTASTGLGKAGSVLTTLLLIYSAFPIAHIIRARGESLGGSHSGIVTFIFKDFVTTNIKILGEVAAVGAFIGACCFTLSFVFDSNLFNAATGTSLGAISGLTSLPMEGLTNLFTALKLDYLTGVLNSFGSFTMASGQNFTGDMLWNINDLFLVAGAFVNVALGLTVLYVNLAIYHFLYTIVSNFIKWIQSPSIPIAMKSK